MLRTVAVAIRVAPKGASNLGLDHIDLQIGRSRAFSNSHRSPQKRSFLRRSRHAAQNRSKTRVQNL